LQTPPSRPSNLLLLASKACSGSAFFKIQIKFDFPGFFFFFSAGCVCLGYSWYFWELVAFIWHGFHEFFLLHAKVAIQHFDGVLGVSEL